MGTHQSEIPLVLGADEEIGEIESRGGGDSGAGSWREHTLRMLKLAAMWMAESRQVRVSEAQTPLLVLAPAIMHAQAPISPFILDCHSGFVWRRGQAPLLFESFDGEIPGEIQDWWLREVSPLAYDGQWAVPRLVARDNYLDQLASFKKR